MRPAVAGALLVLFHGEAAAINIPFRKVHTSSEVQRGSPVAFAAANATFGFTNLDNNVYVADIFVQGQNFSVQLDTGSSDFWVDSSLAPTQALQGVTATAFNATNCYLDTTCASGPIVLADTTFGNFSVPGQALVNAIGSNATYGDVMNGLLGLGGPFAATSSIMRSTASNSSFNGLPFLNNLFGSYPDVENYVTFQLSRTITGDTDGGIFTIGEIAEEWSDVQDTPQLPLLADSWSAGVDGVAVNGKKLALTGSALPGSTQLAALIDTGTARALARSDLVDALYRDLPGAQFDGCCQYTLPCDTKLNVSVLIGARAFPLHPIDVVIVPQAGEEARADADATVCIGAFSYAAAAAAGVDLLLGATFLRNVYARFGFGNWTRADDGPPFVQLRSTTDAGAAWAEFDALNAARLAARTKAETAGKIAGGARGGAGPGALLLLWTSVIVGFGCMGLC